MRLCVLELASLFWGDFLFRLTLYRLNSLGNVSSIAKEMNPSDESSVAFEDDLGEDSDSPGEDVQVKKQTAKSSKSICILLP